MFTFLKFLKHGRYSMNNQEDRNLKTPKKHTEHYISVNLSENIDILHQFFQQTPDLVIRQFQTFNESDAALIYLSGLTDKQTIHNNILNPLMIIIAHLICLDSLGTPYGSPLTPFRFSGMKDSFFRLPLWLMKNKTNNITKNPKENTPNKG
ncbi:spore germination protein (plasmid) [Bacillus mycoides]|nr:spore germination protein [Bacillus mycoides]